MKVKSIEEIGEALAPVAAALGVEIYEIVFKQGRHPALTVFLDTDREGGIDLNTCEKFHNAVDPVLDELDPTYGMPYTLNVSSPGIDRPFKKDSDYLRHIGRSQEEIDRLMEVDDNLANMIRSMVTTGALRDLNQQIIINAIQKAGVVTVTDEEVEKAVEGRITDKTDEETAKRIREEAKDNLAFSKVPDYLIENNTFKLSGDPITPDEYMEDYYKRMSEEQAASEDAKEE